MFASWKEDSKQIKDLCFKHDFQYWKCDKFIKDEKDLEGVKNVCKDNF